MAKCSSTLIGEMSAVTPFKHSSWKVSKFIWNTHVSKTLQREENYTHQYTRRFSNYFVQDSNVNRN